MAQGRGWPKAEYLLLYIVRCHENLIINLIKWRWMLRNLFTPLNVTLGVLKGFTREYKIKLSNPGAQRYDLSFVWWCLTIFVFMWRINCWIRTRWHELKYPSRTRSTVIDPPRHEELQSSAWRPFPSPRRHNSLRHRWARARPRQSFISELCPVIFVYFSAHTLSTRSLVTVSIANSVLKCESLKNLRVLKTRSLAIELHVHLIYLFLQLTGWKSHAKSCVYYTNWWETLWNIVWPETSRFTYSFIWFRVIAEDDVFIQ